MPQNTKPLLSNILGNAVLEEYKGSKRKVVVVKGTTVQVNQPHSLVESMSTHNHEEADTAIPLHVIDTIGDSTLRDTDVWSPDTDALILLMDLVAMDDLVHSPSSISSLENATSIDRSTFVSA